MNNENNQNPQTPAQPQAQTQAASPNQTHSPPQTQQQSSGNAPVETLRDGALKLAIFRNERENGTNFSMEPGRIYTDSDGHIRESKSLSGSEPLRMSRLLDKGYERVGEFKAALKQQRQNSERDR